MLYTISAEKPVTVTIEADSESEALALWEDMDLTPFEGDTLLTAIEAENLTIYWSRK